MVSKLLIDVAPAWLYLLVCADLYVRDFYTNSYVNFSLSPWKVIIVFI